MLLTIFRPIQKRLRKILSYQETKTDNIVFRLHCVLTVALLVGSSLLLTTAQLIGEPIACLTEAHGEKNWAKAIETYCWTTSTFTMPLDNGNLHGRHDRHVGENMVAPGVMNEYDADTPKRHYPYYQWVAFMLFLQGTFCYLPKAVWENCEGGLLARLTTGLQSTCHTEEREKRIDNIISYLLRYRTEHKLYVTMYWCCEALCLLDLLLQMWLMNVFLGGHFASYGLQSLLYSDMPQFERNDPLIYIFPRMTKCTFHHYGPSGSIVNLDSLCVLPQNVINEKVYIILWFWYISLSCLFVLILIYRIFLITYPGLRPRLLKFRTRRITLADARDFTSRLDLGDWWLIYMIAKNVDPLVYRDLLADFIKREKKISHYGDSEKKKPLLNNWAIK